MAYVMFTGAQKITEPVLNLAAVDGNQMSVTAAEDSGATSGALQI